MRHPADVVLVAVVAVGLAADVPLIRGGHESVTARAGATLARRLLVAYFALHFWGLIPSRFDLLCRAGDVLRRFPTCPKT